MEKISLEELPPLLREIPDPPKYMYKEGSLAPPDHTYLAIVGSRRYTTYAKDVIEKLVSGLKGYPVSVISGLALGVDGLAHEAALRHGIHTVAVPGSGLDQSVLYPPRHKTLAKKILDSGGALISEFEPTFRSTTWSFPQRNRIMAGISKATLIIEATLKSGTLITSRLATDYNREVLAVPGSIFSQNTEGPHMLLSLGATPVTSYLDILEALQIDTKTETKTSLSDLTKEEQVVLNILHEPHTKDELIQKLHFPIHQANALITMMELNDLIKEQNG